MALYNYKAISPAKKNVEGLVEADTIDLAGELLQDKGFIVISIKPAKRRFDFRMPEIFNRIKPKELVIFSRQFAVMISANVAMIQALHILVEQTENENLKKAINDIADNVDAGSRLSDALAKKEGLFSDFYISVVRAGETSGRLEDSLNYLADEMEKDYDMNSKIKGAMIYPAFILSGLTVVGIVMMVFVIPKLTDVLKESGAELPMSTKMLIWTSGFMQHTWYLIIIAVFGIFFGAKKFYKTPKGKNFFDYIKLRLPIFGKLFQRIYLVRFTRSMNTLILGGVTITESLRICGEVVSNEIYKELITETVQEVEEGNSISSVFSKSELIPKMVSQMMSIGEKTGKLDLVLSRVTEFYMREIENIVANLMTLMEPIIMVIIGLAVGVMVAAILLPMYNMSTGV